MEYNSAARDGLEAAGVKSMTGPRGCLGQGLLQFFISFDLSTLLQLHSQHIRQLSVECVSVQVKMRTEICVMLRTPIIYVLLHAELRIVPINFVTQAAELSNHLAKSAWLSFTLSYTALQSLHS